MGSQIYSNVQKAKPAEVPIQENNTNGKFLTFKIMNTKVRETLDAWLKYGTAFLILRLGQYYFLENGENPLFEQHSVLLVIFILLGFTIYYLLVKPYIPVSLENPILRNITNDTLMFGTVLVTTHIIESYMDECPYFNNQWLRNSALIIVSSAVYRAIIDPFIPREKFSEQTVSIVNDWLQFGTFLIVFRLLEQKSIVDQRWIFSVLFVLLGFTGYQFITKKLIKIE